MSSSLGDSPVLVSIVSSLGGAVVAYITYIASQRVQTRRANRQPKDRMEQMFDGYERLIKAKDLEDERKTRTIATLEQMVTALEEEVTKAKELVSLTRDELEKSKGENLELRKSLKELRHNYDSIKHSQARH